MQYIVWTNSNTYTVYISPFRDLSFTFIQALGVAAFICIEEEAMEGLRRLLPWKKRSRKTLHVQWTRDPTSLRHRDLISPKRLAAILTNFLLKCGSGEFCETGEHYVFLTGPHTLTSCFPELPYQHVIFYTFSLHFRHLFCVPISSSMSTTHP